MLHRSQRSSVSSQKSQQNSKTEKRIHFNEANIQETHHPIRKDYGFMSIPEAKTPFPRHADPVEAEELRKRLQESLEKANRTLRNELTEDESSLNSNRDVMPTPDISLDYGYEERRRQEFYKKRKQFNQSEFLIAQQKPMNTEMPAPGPSVGENWRIADNNGGHSLYNIPSNMEFIRRTRSQRYQSTLNYEMLQEITDQISQSSEQQLI